MDGELTSSGLSTSIKSNDGSADDKKNDGYVFREREVDAKKNPTKLFRLIMLRQFKTATERLQYNADEASIWVCIPNKKKDSRKKYTARQLPIHIACLLLKPNMPNLLLLIRKLIEVYPDGVRKPDNGGKLPIHIAVWKAAPLPIVVKMLKVDPTSLEKESGDKKKPLEYNPNSKIKNQDDMVNQLNERIRSKKEKAHQEKALQEKSKEIPLKETRVSHPNAMIAILNKPIRDRMSICSVNSSAEPTKDYRNSEVDEPKAELQDVTKENKRMSDVTKGHMNHMFRNSRPESEVLEKNEKLIALGTSHSSLSSKHDDNKEMKDESNAVIDEGDDKINDDMIMSIENESYLPPKQDIDTSRQTSIDNSNDKLEEAFDNNNKSISHRASMLLSALSTDINYYGQAAYMQYYSELENAMHALTDEEKCEQIMSLVKNTETLKKDIWRLKRLIGSHCQWLKYIEMEKVDPQPMWQHGVDKVLRAEVMNELRQLFAGTVALDVPVQLYVSCAAYDDDFDSISVDAYWD